MSKRIMTRPLASMQDILHPEMKIETLKRQVESLKAELNKKEKQNKEKDKKIEELTQINQELTQKNKELDLKGILIPQETAKVSYHKNIEIIEQCLLETNKKVIILCEGARSSWDYKIYSKLYPNAVIVPFGSWSRIEKNLIAYRKISDIFYAIIDGDKRGGRVKSVLMQEGIFCLDVRAIENLFFIDEIFIKVLDDLKIPDSKEWLKKIKEIALEEYKNEESSYELTYKDILLYFPPKKLMGLVFSTIGSNKLAGYFDCAYKNLDNIEIMEVIKKYMPTIIEEI